MFIGFFPVVNTCRFLNHFIFRKLWKRVVSPCDIHIYTVVKANHILCTLNCTHGPLNRLKHIKWLGRVIHNSVILQSEKHNLPIWQMKQIIHHLKKINISRDITLWIFDVLETWAKKQFSTLANISILYQTHRIQTYTFLFSFVLFKFKAIYKI